MEINLKRLNNLAEQIDLNSFYVAEIWKRWMKLQGEYSKELEAKILKLEGFKRVEKLEDGWLRFTRKDIEIVLTGYAREG